jgi:hypothetical protein
MVSGNCIHMRTNKHTVHTSVPISVGGCWGLAVARPSIPELWIVAHITNEWITKKAAIITRCNNNEANLAHFIQGTRSVRYTRKSY